MTTPEEARDKVLSYVNQRSNRLKEYPMAIVHFIRERKVKIGDFENMLDDFYEAGIDPQNRMLTSDVSLFFRDNFGEGDYLDRIMDSPGVMEMFRDISKRKLEELHGDAFKTYKRPKFVLPSSLLTDIRMQKVYDDMIATPVEWQKVFAPPKMRRGQLELLQGLYQSVKENKIVKADTGIGKTWVIVAYSTGKHTVIVEPDKALQSQLKTKYGLTVLMGRANYRCRDYSLSADITPCRFKDAKDSTCSVGCQWHDAYDKAVKSLESGKPVVTNSWNMWQFFENVELVVFDEFHKILNELTVRYEIPEGVTDETGESYLITTHSNLEFEKDRLMYELKEDPENTDKAREYNAIMNELQTLDFFIKSYEGSYIYEDKGKTFLKLDKLSTMKHLAESHSFEKVFVSATPVHINNADLIVTNESVSKRLNAPIVYFPIAKLTSRELNNNPEYLKLAADVINNIYRYYKEHGLTEKVIIHTGNTTTHMELANYLEMSYLKHKKGNLNETMEQFNTGDYQALLIASADAGHDFYGDKFGIQFILKVPYPTRNAEWTATKGKFGEVYERNAYSQETVNQIIQAAGRICRGTDDTGMTVILDQKFTDLFNYNREKFSDSFVERLVDLTGELRRAYPRRVLDYYDGGVNGKEGQGKIH